MYQLLLTFIIYDIGEKETNNIQLRVCVAPLLHAKNAKKCKKKRDKRKT